MCGFEGRFRDSPANGVIARGVEAARARVRIHQRRRFLERREHHVRHAEDRVQRLATLGVAHERERARARVEEDPGAVRLCDRHGGIHGVWAHLVEDEPVDEDGVGATERSGGVVVHPANVREERPGTEIVPAAEGVAAVAVREDETEERLGHVATRVADKLRGGEAAKGHALVGEDALDEVAVLVVAHVSDALGA